MDGWMDGWMGGWVDRWTDEGCMDDGSCWVRFELISVAVDIMDILY